MQPPHPANLQTVPQSASAVVPQQDYRGDFHMHTVYSPDSFMSPVTLARTAERKGLNLVAVTDHNTIRGALAVQQVATIRVIIGEEIRSADGEIIGLFLTEEVPPRLTARETVKRIKDQGGIVQIPHPFDRARGGHITRSALMEILPDIDIMEAFNARTTLRRDVMAAARFIQENQKTHDILATAVTDSHTPFEIGRVWVELPRFEGPQEFLHSLRHARLEGKLVTPLIHVLTRITKWTKPFFG